MFPLGTPREAVDSCLRGDDEPSGHVNRLPYHPEGSPQSPGVISSTELPAGSRK